MKAKNKWEWIQSIRGLAAILVVIFHMWLYIKNTYKLDNVFLDFFSITFIDSGKFAVALFFLISGYLLPYSMKGKTIKEFILNRFIRLYPTYWFSILLALFFVGGYSIIQVIGNITMFQLFLRIPDMIGAYWTLPIELLLYIGCLFALRNLFNLQFIHKIFITFLGLTLIAAFARNYYDKPVPVAIFIILSISILGYYIRLYKEGEINIKVINWSLISFIVAIIPICLMAYNKDWGHNETWYRYVITYTLALIVFFVVAKYEMHCALFTELGKISYSTYLTHGVVIAAFTNYSNLFANMWLESIAMFCIILILAKVTYILIEKPSSKILKTNKKHA